MATMNRNYLAHEYLNGYWHPLYHLDVAREMEPARLSYVGSATLTENMDGLSLTPELQALVSGMRDRGWAETIRDFVANKQFRRDIYMRGASALGAPALVRMIGDIKIAALSSRENVSFKFAGPLGEVQGHSELYGPLADAICNRPHIVREIAALPPFAGKPFAVPLQALNFLIGAGYASPLVSDGKGKAGEAARRLNRVIVERMKQGELLSFVAAPAIGSALPVGLPELVVLSGLMDNAKVTAQQLVDHGWSIMLQTGQRMIRDGKPILEEEGNRAELSRVIEKVITDKKPVWQLLGVY